MRHCRYCLVLGVLLFAAGITPDPASASPKGVPPPPAPVADYDMLGWLGDALGNGQRLTQVGAAAGSYVTVTADGNTRTVLAVPEGSGLRLASDALLALDSYSIALIVSVAGTGSYAKLIDTNALASDRGVYANGNSLRYYSAASGLADSFPDGALRQVVVTRAADHRYIGYLDGVEQFRFEDADNSQASQIAATRLLHFLRDDDATANVEESEAVVHRIRLFDRTLSPAEVAALETDRGALISVFRNGGFESAS